MFGFTAKTVLVTGAGGGSGEAIAKTFLAHGAYVIAADLYAPRWECASEERLQRTAMDVTDENAVDRVVSDARREGHVVNILVNNAGVSVGGPVGSMSTQAWFKNINTNVTGAFFCIRAAVTPMMEAREGRIINIGSIAGKNGFPNLCAYGASKAALIGMTRSLAVELGPYNITVNTVCPGTVDTPMIQKLIRSISENTGKSYDEIKRGMESEIPMGRLQQAQDVADMVIFLASDMAKNINGESINIDGGTVRD
ncbi:MAG: SDR family NAD(P)-dependent oxidoreductase [Bacillota bacterium]